MARRALVRIEPGQVFGRWTVTGVAGKTATCFCTCGTVGTVDTNNLKRGMSQSCGCLRRELARDRMSTHGASKTDPRYAIWANMIMRCENEKNPSYKFYGARGIQVCEQWHDFLIFCADVGERPKGLQLDRIDNDGNYEPNNCTWVTPKQNSRNRRDSHYLSLNGVRHTIVEWVEVLDVPERRLRGRVSLGWSDEDILTKPPQKTNHSRL